MASTDTSGSPRRPLPSKDPFLNEQSGFSPNGSDDWQRNQSAVEKVRKSGKVGERLPAAFDENRTPAGRFAKGHMVRSGGAKKRLTRKQVWERAQARGGTPLLRKLAAQALGLFEQDQQDQIPDDLETAEDFQIWVMTQRAVFNIDAFREIWDRLDPKPQKVQIDATLTARRAPISGSLDPGEAAEAEAYMAEVHDPASADEDDDEEELVEIEAAPEADLDFLE